MIASKAFLLGLLGKGLALMLAGLFFILGVGWFVAKLRGMTLSELMDEYERH